MYLAPSLLMKTYSLLKAGPRPAVYFTARGPAARGPPLGPRPGGPQLNRFLVSDILKRIYSDVHRR